LKEMSTAAKMLLPPFIMLPKPEKLMMSNVTTEPQPPELLPEPPDRRPNSGMQVTFSSSPPAGNLTALVKHYRH
jgi:hypothetical protein